MRFLRPNLKTIPQQYVAYLIFLIITVIYLFPAFLGKIDTPIDIRDSRMYPWSYYAVDKKIKTFTLWESDSFKEQNITVAPELSKELTLKIQTDKHLVDELSRSKSGDITYYFVFNFKGIIDRDSNLTFDVYLTDPATRLDFKLPIEVIKLATDKKEQKDVWSKAYVSLKEVMKSALTVDDLSVCNLKIKVKNNSKSTVGIFYLRNIKLISDDYSKILKAHNPYVEDLILAFTPFREYYSKNLRKGKIPFWNNYILTGTEFLSEPQLGYFHPVCFLSYFLFEHFIAHEIVTFICLLLCGIGAYLLTRYWGFGQAVSVFTGIVYMFHPYNVLWFGFEHMLMNSATLPFLLLSYEKHLKQEKFLNKYLIINTLLLGLIFLSGHLQISYYTIIFFFLYACFLFFRDLLFTRNYIIEHIKSILFIFSIALMIGSVVLIPFFPFMHESHRVPLTEAAMKEVSTPLKAFLTLVKPAAIDERTLSYFYFGILPLFFSVFALSMLFRKGLTIFLFVSIVFSLLICTGSPLFFLIKDFIPGFNQIQHHRFLEIYSYCVPFLAGIGLQILTNRLTFVNKKAVLVFSSLVIVISACDLLYNSSTYYMSWFDRKDYKPMPKSGSLEFLINEQKKQKEPFRVLPFVTKDVQNVKLRTSVALPNTLIPYGLEDISGYTSFIPKDLYVLFIYIQTHDPKRLYSKKIDTCFSNFNVPYPISNYRSKLIDLLNVKYFLVPNFFILESKDTKKVYEGDCAIYENMNYFPRVFIVPGYKVIDSPKETIVELDSDKFDPYKEVILMTVPLSLRTNRSNDNDSILQYKVDFLKYDQSNITLKINVNQPGFLILGNNLNNNWRVKINGREGKHYQANLIQRAVYLPSVGNYVIEFYYFPKLFLIGFSITCLGLFILALLWFNVRRRS